MNWLRAHRRSAWICGAVLILPLLLYLQGLLSLWALGAGYREEIRQIEPRIARLRGLVGNEAPLREAVNTGSRQAAELVYPAALDPPTVAASLQKDVRQILADAGLDVSNSQVLPVRQTGSFDLIGVRLTASGGIDSVDAALDQIGRYAPLLLVESLEVVPANARRGGDTPQQLTVNLQLLSLRALL